MVFEICRKVDSSFFPNAKLFSFNDWILWSFKEIKTILVNHQVLSNAYDERKVFSVETQCNHELKNPKVFPKRYYSLEEWSEMDLKVNPEV